MILNLLYGALAIVLGITVYLWIDLARFQRKMERDFRNGKL
mgnify:CR=1 FL=1